MSQFGIVKFFNEQKGYGFIGAGGEDVFMHIGEMADGMMPRKGDILNYDMGKNKKKPGKLMAVNVRGGSATQLAYGAAEYGGDSMDMRSMMPMMHMMMTMMFDKSKWSQFEEKLDALEKGFQELRMLVEDVKEIKMQTSRTNCENEVDDLEKQHCEARSNCENEVADLEKSAPAEEEEEEEEKEDATSSSDSEDQQEEEEGFVRRRALRQHDFSVRMVRELSKQFESSTIEGAIPEIDETR
jgi:cold shock CspA family protein